MSLRWAEGRQGSACDPLCAAAPPNLKTRYEPDPPDPNCTVAARNSAGRREEGGKEGTKAARKGRSSNCFQDKQRRKEGVAWRGVVLPLSAGCGRGGAHVQFLPSMDERSFTRRRRTMNRSTHARARLPYSGILILLKGVFAVEQAS